MNQEYVRPADPAVRSGSVRYLILLGIATALMMFGFDAIAEPTISNNVGLIIMLMSVAAYVVLMIVAQRLLTVGNRGPRAAARVATAATIAVVAAVWFLTDLRGLALGGISAAAVLVAYVTAGLWVSQS